MTEEQHIKCQVKNQSNTIPQKENDISPEAKFKVMEYHNLTDKKFKRGVMKKFIEQQENSERQFNELRNKINGQTNTLPKRLKY